MAMFPPALPHVIIRWLTDEGDVVFDPFCGRGTTPFEACLLGRRGFGADANPMAWLLTRAKVDPPTKRELATRIAELRSKRRVRSVEREPAQIRMLFSDQTLAQLVWLRDALNLSRRTDRFLMAVLLGVLHRNASRSGRALGLTVAMPNTFAMAPGYVGRYIKANRLRPPVVDVLRVLETRIERFDWPTTPFRRGRAWRGNATARVKWPNDADGAKLILSSPPYLEVIKYGKYNWIRLWMLGEDPAQLDQQLYASASLEGYVAFLSGFLVRSLEVLRDDGFVCLVIGDVRRDDTDLNLARVVAERCVPNDLQVVGVAADRLATERKVSRIWGDNRGRATKTDRVLVLKTRSARAGGLGRLSWAS
jgi:hypothetical protein